MGTRRASSEQSGPDIRGLLGSSATYAFGNVLVRGLSVLLLPLYTRWLTPSDYGITSIAATVSSALGIVLTLGLHASITRIYYMAGTEQERRDQCGTIAIALALFSLVITASLDLLGPTLTPLLFDGLDYAPYIRLAVWTAFLGTFGLLPPLFFQLKQQPQRFVALALCNATVTIACTVWLVGVEGRGAYGYLLAGLYSALLMALPFAWLALRNIHLVVRWPVLTSALSFGLPIVPHSLSTWVLDLSDRVILQRNVPLAEVGLYSLAYQFGLVMLILASSVNAAWTPYFYKKFAEEGDASKPEVARVVTYFVAVLCMLALAGALLAPEAIFVFLAPGFRSSEQYVPWLLAAYLFSGLYYIPASFLGALGRSKTMAILTATAALLNLILNIWLIPTYGVLAACWSTVAAYFMMLVLYVWAARRIYPFPYEYHRIAIIFVLAAACFAIGQLIDTAWVAANIVLKLVILGVAASALVALELRHPYPRSIGAGTLLKRKERA